MKQKRYGLALCFSIAGIAWVLGNIFYLIGHAVFSLLIGMLCHLFIKHKEPFKDGVTFATKKLLQLAVILLGFGLNLEIVAKVGLSSLPIILFTIASALICGFICAKAWQLPLKLTTLISVGTSICGGSAIMTTAPIIQAEDDEIAQSISVIFLFNLLAIFLFPFLATQLHLSHDGFALFTGTAVNDTSSVTAVASIWDNLHHLGNNTLNTATIVKLTRTLAIIPISFMLAFWKMKQDKTQAAIRLIHLFPTFILYFLLAACLTTLLSPYHLPAFDVFISVTKWFSKFLIVVAMAGIGFNTNIVQLAKRGQKSLLLGLCCWISVILCSLLLQWGLGLL